MNYTDFTSFTSYKDIKKLARVELARQKKERMQDMFAGVVLASAGYFMAIIFLSL